MLSFEPDGKGSYLIVGETDATTEQNLAKKAKGAAFVEHQYCFSDAGTIFTEVAVPAPYELSFTLSISGGKVTGTGIYYSSSMRSMYDLSITGTTEEGGVLNLKVRGEGPLYPDEPNDVMNLSQKWKYTGEILRWLSGDDLGSLEMGDVGCNN
jgi:hypothetical protein